MESIGISLEATHISKCAMVKSVHKLEDGGHQSIHIDLDAHGKASLLTVGGPQPITMF